MKQIFMLGQHLGGIFFKIVKAVIFSRKSFFQKCFSLYCETFIVTNFKQILCISNGNMRINKLLKILIIALLNKLCLVFSTASVVSGGFTNTFVAHFFLSSHWSLSSLELVITAFSHSISCLGLTALSH